MKYLILLLTASLPVAVLAQKVEKPAAAPKENPPPISVVTAPVPTQQVYVYEQKLMGGRAPLVTPEQAQGIITRFKAAYPKLNNPRVVVFVNRDLVDEKSGLKLIARTEKTEGQANNEKVNAENRYRQQDRKEDTLADKQTIRDVERLFGRPFRSAGVPLADQRVATQFLPSKGFQSLAAEGDQARRDREALSSIADVAIEVLISSKDVQVAELGGDRKYTVPDIHATAIRLKDARIVGQAASSEIMGRAGQGLRYLDVREVTEATALALMEDMLTEVDLVKTEPEAVK